MESLARLAVSYEDLRTEGISGTGGEDPRRGASRPGAHLMVQIDSLRPTGKRETLLAFVLMTARRAFEGLDGLGL